MNKKYCHIPKTGGVSICKLIGRLPGHAIESETKNKYIYTFVRNPYDRLISTFFYLKNGGRNNGDKKDRDKYIGNSSFEDFVKTKLINASKNQIHFRPQKYWIPNGASFIGKFENLENDFNEVKKIVGIKGNLQHLNKTSHKDYREYYNDELANIVYKVYEEDFEEFGYDKNSYKK